MLFRSDPKPPKIPPSTVEVNFSLADNTSCDSQGPRTSDNAAEDAMEIDQDSIVSNTAVKEDNAVNGPGEKTSSKPNVWSDGVHQALRGQLTGAQYKIQELTKISQSQGDFIVKLQNDLNHLSSNRRYLQGAYSELEHNHNELKRKHETVLRKYEDLDRKYMDIARSLQVTGDDRSTINKQLEAIYSAIETMVIRLRGKASVNLNRAVAIEQLRDFGLLQDFPIQEDQLESFHLNLLMECALMCTLSNHLFSRPLQCIFDGSQEFETICELVEQRGSKASDRWRQELCILIAQDGEGMAHRKEIEVSNVKAELEHWVSSVYGNVDAAITNKIQELCSSAFDLSYALLGMESRVYPVWPDIGSQFNNNEMKKSTRSNPEGLVPSDTTMTTVDDPTGSLLHSYDDDEETLYLGSQQNGHSQTPDTPLPAASATATMPVVGMTCMSCVNAITSVLSSQPGIQNVLVSLRDKQATVTYSPSTITPAQIKDHIEDCGFDVPVDTDALQPTSAGTPEPAVSPRTPMPITATTVTPVRATTPPVSQLTSSCPANTLTAQLSIQGMTCASCVASIERAMQGTPGLVSIKVALLAERATVEYIPSLTSPKDLADLIDDIGFEASPIQENRPNQVDLQVFGMTCASCVHSIETELRKMPGILSANVSLTLQGAKVEYDSQVVGVRDIVERIEDMGFDALLAERSQNAQVESLSRTKEITEWRNTLKTSVILAIPVFLISMVMPMFAWGRAIYDTQLFFHLAFGDVLAGILTIPVQFGVGRRFIISAYKALKHGVATMDVLISLGTLSAFTFSVFSMLYTVFSPDHPKASVFFDTSSMLITFVTIGRYLENMAKGQTSVALSKLMCLTPPTCTIYLRDPATGERVSEKEIPSELVQKGDWIKVVPGDKIPTDGLVISGQSTVDESMVTGEAESIFKGPGSTVIGGTVNALGTFDMEATRVGSETTLAQIVQLVEDAQTSKAPIQAYADKIAGVFVPTVILIALMTFVGWMIISHTLQQADLPTMFLMEPSKFVACLKLCISVIVVACPCALGLSTPTAVMVGTGVGAQNGILIKSAVALEEAHKITMVVFDKTGTLTHGKLQVAEWSVKPSASSAGTSALGSLNDNDFYTIVGAAESASEHPLGRAIGLFAKEKLGTEQFQATVTDFSSKPGQGIECSVATKSMTSPCKVMIGNTSWLKERQVELPTQLASEKAEQEKRGRTTVLVAMNNNYVGWIALSDTIKKEAARTVSRLQQMGIQVAMVTGDQPLVAQVMANECGIQQVHAGVSPAGKTAIVSRLQNEGHCVAMIGDGINDSPALAQSNLGIALKSGTDIAMEAADMVLMRGDLTDVVAAMELCRVIFRRIRYNFAWACIYNVLGVPLAMGLFLPWGYHIHPMMAGLMMAFSSVSVVCSSLLLKRWKKPHLRDVTQQEREAILRKELQKKKEATIRAHWRMQLGGQKSSKPLSRGSGYVPVGSEDVDETEMDQFV
ncbi:P-type Cu+ transporter [Entomortierella parvispora]|uniref:P-type Cu(+) transporter n=1 Tax=Entomortierella parvispora TaxID=205924 RepID=A0A9P3LUW5_9FUNG|nr:P-type Cu+ transporter [Entomortierella parvispora]